MAEKRGRDRIRRRIQLRYGEDGKMRTAFTEDFSPTGLFIKAALVHPPNTLLDVELLTEDSDEVIIMQVRVMWAKRVPPNLMRLSQKSGMGVRIRGFRQGQDRYLALCQEYSRRKETSVTR